MKKRGVNYIVLIVAALQCIFAFRVLVRLLRSVSGECLIISQADSEEAMQEQASVVVPVLNEVARLTPCLEGLMKQGEEVAEILVVDGGSVDDTQGMIQQFAMRDPRIRFVDASPIPPDWNGKAWGLQVGLCEANPALHWLLTVDADVRPQASLVRVMLAQAHKIRLSALSIATQQEITDVGQGLLHPSLLTTLVYRFGIPGKIINRVSEVQANGQCFLFHRENLEALGGFAVAARSLCEDVTIARALVANGYPVGFYEAGDLVSVKMYADWRETWQNWTRSLPMHDRFSGPNTALGLLEVLLVQALPLPIFLYLARNCARNRTLFLINAFLAMIRVGVLFSTARAYQKRPWSYWFSPACDIPVVLQLVRSLITHHHQWRGRLLVRGDG